MRYNYYSGEGSIYLSHERFNLVLGCGEGGGSAHTGVHHLCVYIQIFKQVFKLPHCRGDLGVCVCVWRRKMAQDN